MKITWTQFSIRNLKQIYDYYVENANRNVAHEIRKQILKSTQHLKKFPEIGKTELHLEKLNQKHRYIVSGNYKVIYHIKIHHEEIVISDVFDTRQNPTKLNDEKRNID